MKQTKIISFVLIILYGMLTGVHAQKAHPNLILTSKDVEYIKPQLTSYPLFKNSIEQAEKKIKIALQGEIDVPVPKHAGGGYTHEKHKQNYDEMHQAGILYQLTKEKKYLTFIKSMLDKYADLYPTLGSHPQGKKQTPGKMFWQRLNETVWLLHTIQAYDCIYNDLSQEDRDNYENNIFHPMVYFFMNDCRDDFNLIHNHGTWIVAAVGMTGFVLDNKDYYEKAIHGFDGNDETGFLAQLNKLFSPDGYYTEGGYYARYALWPFFIFAESIKNNLPEVGIYKYRNEILKKAFNSALQVTYTNGEFIPINDAIKEKTWLTSELVFGSNFTYANYENDKRLLNLVKLHNRVSLSGSGFKVAKDLYNSKAIPEFSWHSVEFTDGPDGDEGGVTILRSGDNSDQEAVLLKYGSHGLSHGHFDKLTFLFYDQGREIIQDYGAARFLNIEQKYGGRYLPENNTFAKQTIAHNTLVVDEKSQYDGSRSRSQANHSEKYSVDYSNPDFQYASAKENNAYQDVNMHRTLCLINDEVLSKPIIVDLLNVHSKNKHQYDLPFYYKGHFLSANFEYEAFTKTKTLLGAENGYQHLWKEGSGKPNGKLQFTWLNGERFYTITSNTDQNTEVIFTRIGASDPNFNLRNEPGILLRQNAKSRLFASVIEPHGSFDPILEKTLGAYCKIKDIIVVQNNEKYTAVNILGDSNIDWTVLMANDDSDKTSRHKIVIDNNTYSWIGPVSVQKK